MWFVKMDVKMLLHGRSHKMLWYTHDNCLCVIVDHLLSYVKIKDLK